MAERRRRSIGKVDKLPPELKTAVEQMLLDNQHSYREIVAYLAAEGHEMSQMAISNYARKFLDGMRMMQVAQENFRVLADVIERSPNLDTTEALKRLASQHLFNALAGVTVEKMAEVEVADLLRQTNSLIRASAMKQKADVQTKSAYEAALDAQQDQILDGLAKDDPALYKRLADYLTNKKKEGEEP